MLKVFRNNASAIFFFSCEVVEISVMISFRNLSLNMFV